MRFPHTLSLHDARDIHSLHCHFERSEKSFSSPFSTTPSLSLLGEAPSPPFLRYGVSHFSLSGTLPLTANEKDPSAPLGMTLRKWRFPNIPFIRDVGYPSPHTVISSAVEKSSLHSALSCSFRKSFPLFRCHTYNAISVCKKDPSAPLGMTIREERVSQRTLYTIQRISIPPHCHFERSEKSFSSPLFHDSFAKPFTGSTVPTFSRYGVSHFSLSGTLPLAANEKDPSASLGMTIREECFLSTAFAGYVG